jgi:RNA polymerase sigma factor (sigma-70 family)
MTGSDSRDISDIELVRRCANDPDNELAWREFVCRFNEHISLWIMRTYNLMSVSSLDLTASQQQETIRDLVQNVYIRLLENRRHALKTFRGKRGGSVYAYLAKIATTVVADYLRHETAEKRAAQVISLDEPVVIGEESSEVPRECVVADPKARPVDQSPASITINDLVEQLDHLVTGEHKDRDMLILLLHLVDGLTAEEIASIREIGLEQSGIASVISRNKSKLKEELGKEWKKKSSE